MKFRIYTVKRGDTLWGIAKKELGSVYRYADIVIINNIKYSVLRKGQKLLLPVIENEKRK